VGTRFSYQVLIVADIVAFLAAAGLLQRLPAVPPTASGNNARRRKFLALRDGPYLAVTALMSILSPGVAVVG